LIKTPTGSTKTEDNKPPIGNGAWELGFAVDGAYDLIPQETYAYGKVSFKFGSSYEVEVNDGKDTIEFHYGSMMAFTLGVESKFLKTTQDLPISLGLEFLYSRTGATEKTDATDKTEELKGSGIAFLDTTFRTSYLIEKFPGLGVALGITLPLMNSWVGEEPQDGEKPQRSWKIFLEGRYGL